MSACSSCLQRSNAHDPFAILEYCIYSAEVNKNASIIIALRPWKQEVVSSKRNFLSQWHCSCTPCPPPLPPPTLRFIYWSPPLCFWLIRADSCLCKCTALFMLCSSSSIQPVHLLLFTNKDHACFYFSSSFCVILNWRHWEPVSCIYWLESIEFAYSRSHRLHTWYLCLLANLVISVRLELNTFTWSNFWDLNIHIKCQQCFTSKKCKLCSCQ